uniref:RING-type domain-containing protein n=1 Tax=Hemiselmis andersenii TaxID=464988 RepID=A0A6U4TS67_HEMAN|mmetsp:Transcript_28631/g.66936  ORF Transcript_28631/g.66936 Transcript_28631/m.66936 type:complete len:454 (+) Transcript_28631:310-1671(+)
MVNEGIENVDPNIRHGSNDGQAGSPKQSAMVRVLTAMSWCGRSSKLWHKGPANSSNNGDMNPPRRPGSNSNRVSPSPYSSQNSSPHNLASDRGSGRPSPLDFLHRSEESTPQYRLYCPICMYYYAETYRTRCCNHHICANCTTEMVWRNHRANNSVELTDEEIASMACPHCSSEALKVNRITVLDGGGDYRRYEDSPGFNKTGGAHRPRTGTTPIGTGGASVAPSPLKIGDTYENMMKKMLTYDQCGINIRAQQTITATPGRSPSPPADVAEFPLPGAPFPPLPEDGSGSQRQLGDDGPSNRSESGSCEGGGGGGGDLSMSSSSRAQGVGILAMSIPPELQRPPPAGRRPPRPADGSVPRPSGGSRGGSRAASPSLNERPPSPVAPGPDGMVIPSLVAPPNPLELSGAKIPSPGRALVYMVDDNADAGREITPRGGASGSASPDVPEVPGVAH